MTAAAILGEVNKVKYTHATYTLTNSLVLFNHVITVARLGMNVFIMLQFKTHKTSI